MNQPYSNDKIWFSPSQLLMCRRVKTALRDRVREREECVECLRLRVFKSLLTSHTTAMYTCRYTCGGWEYWSERTRGRASRHVGGVHRGRDRLSNRKRFPVLLDFKLNIWSPMNDIKYTDFLCLMEYWHRTSKSVLQWRMHLNKINNAFVLYNKAYYNPLYDIYIQVQIYETRGVGLFCGISVKYWRQQCSSTYKCAGYLTRSRVAVYCRSSSFHCFESYCLRPD